MNAYLEKYFGAEGPWIEAAVMYRQQEIPADVMDQAIPLGESRTAFCLGYAFAAVLARRGMRITRDHLEQISWIKITDGDPEQFVNGFRHYESGFAHR